MVLTGKDHCHKEILVVPDIANPLSDRAFEDLLEQVNPLPMMKGMG